ncbi:unnamed protein product [Trichobilharzia regenti]|nr:unnamed protein product [Trichobilharzia regenti]
MWYLELISLKDATDDMTHYNNICQSHIFICVDSKHPSYLHNLFSKAYMNKGLIMECGQNGKFRFLDRELLQTTNGDIQRYIHREEFYNEARRIVCAE